jgi:hypothetical protein
VLLDICLVFLGVPFKLHDFIIHIIVCIVKGFF